MSLNLYMVGIIVAEMKKSVEFYRRLGVEIPEGIENNIFVSIKMGDLTFFLSTKDQNRIWDPLNSTNDSDGYRIILEFYLKTQDAVINKYNELWEYGYEGHLEPYLTPFNIYFAIIKDPDGNQILLSGEIDKKNKMHLSYK